MQIQSANKKADHELKHEITKTKLHGKNWSKRGRFGNIVVWGMVGQPKSMVYFQVPSLTKVDEDATFGCRCRVCLGTCETDGGGLTHAYLGNL